MRVLGLDVGDRRIGIAISDDLGLTAQGLAQLDRRNTRADMTALQEIVATHNVHRIVVGMPRNMNSRSLAICCNSIERSRVIDSEIGKPILRSRSLKVFAQRVRSDITAADSCLSFLRSDSTWSISSAS